MQFLDTRIFHNNFYKEVFICKSLDFLKLEHWLLNRSIEKLIMSQIISIYLIKMEFCKEVESNQNIDQAT